MVLTLWVKNISEMARMSQGGLQMEKTICELFAGVGGFRLGFERSNPEWNTVWFSQWEPGAKTQWAHDCYVSHFGDLPDNKGELHTGDDISTVVKKNIPNHSVLVGGFPCQDYSVAHPLNSSHGIEGEKGVLWWQIRDILMAKKAPFCVFENVDRLLKSPAKQRGRDFGIILGCLAQLGYSAEWRVINAAEYGAAQRRRRTFIFAYKNNTIYGKARKKTKPIDILQTEGLMAKAFPVSSVGDIREIVIEKYKEDDDIASISDSFKFEFDKAGYMYQGHIYTAEVEEEKVNPITLNQILIPCEENSRFIDESKMSKWTYLKGSKKIPRKTKEGHEYIFSEGPVAFPDPWNKPGRTMLTSESTLNRSTHVVADPATGGLRLLMPIEAERLQGFDDNWTDTGMPDRMRFFCMGNALVVSMITRMAGVLEEIINNEP